MMNNWLYISFYETSAKGGASLGLVLDFCLNSSGDPKVFVFGTQLIMLVMTKVPIPPKITISIMLKLM